MTTKIRQIRKQRGLTLQALADQVGTTPQTIQRLETNNMTISVEWLERIGQALAIPAAALLDSYTAPSVRVLGDLVANGSVKARKSTALEVLALEVPGEDPMAVKLACRFGPHETGTILIASRLDQRRHADADGRDCLVGVASGQLLFRRLVLSKNSTAAYVPYDDQGPVERNLEIAWIAPVVMSVRYLSVQKA
jgi:transcriptional regulator with XRE-family HTH domain